jgi:hypothetical protein
MARIRTIKPDFFRHEELYQAEKETGLPLRIAFAGLWTVADREGRFRWRPREIKLDVLPYDDVDFSRVLDALTTRHFLAKYSLADDVYGYIPSFKKHQLVNNRESASRLPDPLSSEVITLRVGHASPTRHDLDQGEGEGEGNRKEDTDRRAIGGGVGEGSSIPVASSASPQKSPREAKKQRGEFKNVLLTDTESKKLIEEYGKEKAQACVNFLSAYREEKGYKNRSDYLSIRRWVANAVDETSAKKGGALVSRPDAWNKEDIRREQEELAEKGLTAGERASAFDAWVKEHPDNPLAKRVLADVV